MLRHGTQYGAMDAADEQRETRYPVRDEPCAGSDRRLSLGACPPAADSTEWLNFMKEEERRAKLGLL